MRHTNEVEEFKNLFTGVISCTGTAATTYVGSGIDTLNYASIKALLSMGNPTGTNAQGITVNVKWQESVSLEGLAGSWSDINDGALTGTMSFTTAALLANTTYLYQDMIFERLDDANRERFIRPHVTVTGTAGLSLFSCTIGALLGNPRNSEDITTGVTTPTSLDSSPQALFYSTY